MKIHNLKLNKAFVDDVMSGIKTFEFRLNDRDYQVGDLVHFTKTNGNEFIYDEWRGNIFRITYVLRADDGIVGENGSFRQIKDFVPLEEGWCIFSIKRIN